MAISHHSTGTGGAIPGVFPFLPVCGSAYALTSLFPVGRPPWIFFKSFPFMVSGEWAPAIRYFPPANLQSFAAINPVLSNPATDFPPFPTKACPLFERKKHEIPMVQRSSFYSSFFSQFEEHINSPTMSSSFLPPLIK